MFAAEDGDRLHIQVYLGHRTTYEAQWVLFEQSVDELSEVNEIIELRVGRFPLPRGKKSASTDCPNTTAQCDHQTVHHILV
jgi:hypothetical protein